MFIMNLINESIKCQTSLNESSIKTSWMNPRKPGNQNSLESAMVKSPNSLENSFKISINLSCLEHYGNNLDLVVDLARVEEKVQQ